MSGTSIKAVILDWAGVTVDHGSRAPAQVFREVFRRHGVEIAMAEARGPMGRAKRDHIVEIASMPRVAEAWRQAHGRLPSDADIQRMYDDFRPLQIETLSRDTAVIPGVATAISKLRERGIKIGSTTGYTREMMEVVIPIAARGGYEPDTVVCADDVPEGRPAPWMNFLAAQRMNVYPFCRIIVVDDTRVGISAGINAGAIAIGVSRTGNSMGLTESEVSALSATQLQARLAEIDQDFRATGAYDVIQSVADLPDVVSRLTSS